MYGWSRRTIIDSCWSLPHLLLFNGRNDAGMSKYLDPSDASIGKVVELHMGDTTHHLDSSLYLIHYLKSVISTSLITRLQRYHGQYRYHLDNLIVVVVVVPPIGMHPRLVQ